MVIQDTMKSHITAHVTELETNAVLNSFDMNSTMSHIFHLSSVLDKWNPFVKL